MYPLHIMPPAIHHQLCHLCFTTKYEIFFCSLQKTLQRRFTLVFYPQTAYIQSSWMFYTARIRNVISVRHILAEIHLLQYLCVYSMMYLVFPGNWGVSKAYTEPIQPCFFTRICSQRHLQAGFHFICIRQTEGNLPDRIQTLP